MRDGGPCLLWTLSLIVFLGLVGPYPAMAQLRGGAAAVDITPTQLPVIVNGGFLEAVRDRVSDRLTARGLVLADSHTTLAIAIVDSCMIPRDVCDRIKSLVAQATDIPMDKITIAATHTHSAPSVMDFCLGSRRDVGYTEFLVPKVVECLIRAHSRLQPVEVGWAVAQAPQHTHCRRWLRRPDQIGLDPFGQRTVHAMMHPGYQNPEYLGPAGPVDTALTLLSIRSVDGVPLCILANYSMHYVGGVSGISADYFGYFSAAMRQRVRAAIPATDSNGEFVAIMSQGTSGDLHWMDYSLPGQNTTPRQFASELADIAFDAYQQIAYRQTCRLEMAESTMRLTRRRPDPQRLAWARELNAQRGTRRPRSQPEVYAEQAVWIDEHPDQEIVLQAIRIGEFGITAIPNEVYAVTGLKLKAQSPLRTIMNIELANGAEGYIPPPEQHELGGYTTWPARTAGLEVQAEPKIVDRVLMLLEQIARKSRRPLDGDLYPEAIRRCARP